MSTPPLMVGAGLLFWGLQADLMHFAIPMAIILEGARWAHWRWEFTDNDFNRLTDLSSLLFILAALYLFSREGAHGVFAIATWLPLLLFLLLASQKYSSRGDIGITALFLGLRRMEARGVKVPRRRIDLTYPYFSTCLIASAMTNPTSPWFFPGAMILTAWALLGIRPHRYPLGLWLLLITLAGMLGYFGQMGLRAAQLELEEIVLSWFEGRLWNRTDPYRSSTAIGHIGRLKFSDRIILQVKRPNSAVGPLLLRQASYRNYSFGTWSVGKAPFEILPRGGEIGTWILAPEKLDGESITVSGYMQDGNGLLALPGGGYRIENLPAVALKRNPFGAVKMDEGPGFAAFRVHFQPSLSTDHSPQKTDLRIPERQRPTIERIIRELKFVDKPPGEILEATGEFFQDNFSYSLFSRAAVGNSTPLSSFLLTKRQGHCEYFASATVLLLRAAGIPARYATGFSAQEYDSLTG
ncbi:MAG: transglutaminase domain-containing protein, partial [Gammaproteobacteria bacterium]|nr:transglutaminase domain-containing protein [Gammaproteobacteria bacterium]